MKTYRKDVHATLNGRAITISVAVTAEEEADPQALADLFAGCSLSEAAFILREFRVLHTRGPVEVPHA